MPGGDYARCFDATLAGLLVSAGPGFGDVEELDQTLDGQAVGGRAPWLGILGAEERGEVGLYPNRFIQGRGDDAPSVRAEGRRDDSILMAAKDQEFDRPVGIPYPYCLVLGCGNECSLYVNVQNESTERLASSLSSTGGGKVSQNYASGFLGAGPVYG